MAMFGGGGFEFGGGGFASQQPSEGGQGSGGKGRQNRDQTLRAVTIRQLATAAANSTPDQDLVIDGADLSNVTLVGKVVSCAERAGNIDLQISDGTGVISITYFVDSADSDPQAIPQKVAELRPGTYVRTYGHMRAFQGSWSISAFAVRVVHDFNEVTYHCLQAIFQHMHLAKGGGAGTGGATQQQQAGLNSYSGPAAGGWQQKPQQQQGSGYGGGAPVAGPPGMDPCASAVLQVVSDPNTGDSGVHVNDICGRLAPRGFGRPQVEAALNFLQNEAHCYTTCDENHWRAT